MSVVRFESVSKSYGPKLVLEHVTLDLQHGEKVGLVGANGAGKTTLFKLITGEQTPDEGRVIVARGLKVGYLPQIPVLDASSTVLDEAGSVFGRVWELERTLVALAHEMTAQHDSDRLPHTMARYDRLRAEFETAGGYTIEARIGEVLGGLGFGKRAQELTIGVLSGGQKCRVALAKLLLSDCDLLLLDEPTNHLDIAATQFLEAFLASFSGGVVVVSHDRYLLDRVVSKIIELERRRVTLYPTNYTHYAESKHIRGLTAEREYAKQQSFIAHERDFIARHLAGQRSQEAKGRRTRLARMAKEGHLVARPQAARQRINLDFDASASSEGTALRCEDVVKRYGPLTLFDGLRFQVQRGERVGIIGPNGVGKSTLLRIIMGSEPADAGTVEFYERAAAGYYDQEHAGLNRERSVIAELRALRPDASDQELRTFLAGFLFTGDDAFKRVGDLSGGEQSRVVLAKLMWSATRALVLDEPTNHLDIPSREALEEALRAYAGTIIMVSHDRYFLDRVVTHLLVLEPGGYERIVGNYTEWQQQRAAALAASQVETVRAAKRKRAGDTPKQAARRAASEPRPTAKYDRLSLEEIETMIIDREGQLAAMQQQFGDEATYRDPERRQALQAAYDELKRELAELNAAWEERA
jgi:ATP-binding cassette subfamily F protein 3